MTERLSLSSLFHIHGLSFCPWLIFSKWILDQLQTHFQDKLSESRGKTLD